MDDGEHPQQENTKDDDSVVEITELEPTHFTHPADKLKYALSSHIAERLQTRRFLLKRGKTQLAITTVVAIVGLVVLLSVSGVFSSLFASLAHPLAPFPSVYRK